MKQNAALEMFEYLKEHLIPLAKDKGDKVYESDTTVQIARPENKSVWDCEKEVKQLLSKIGAYSASVNACARSQCKSHPHYGQQRGTRHAILF